MLYLLLFRNTSKDTGDQLNQVCWCLGELAFKWSRLGQNYVMHKYTNTAWKSWLEINALLIWRSFPFRLWKSKDKLPAVSPRDRKWCPAQSQIWWRGGMLEFLQDLEMLESFSPLAGNHLWTRFLDPLLHLLLLLECFVLYGWPVIHVTAISAGQPLHLIYCPALTWSKSKRLLTGFTQLRQH